jgi:hypothetical protein
MEQGNHAEAAVIFANLAKRALDRNVLKHGIMMLLQAGNAYVLAGEVEKGMAEVRRGLELIAEHERWEALYRAGQRAVTTLNESGNKDEAQELQAWLDKQLAGHEDAIREAKARMSKKVDLPAKCPYCGASVRPDEVNWYDDGSVECAYCGSTVQADE